MTRTKITIILIAFLILAITGIYTLYHVYQIPETETQTIPLWEYQHLGIYNYTAQLKPNLVYNKTTLTPGEGPVYLRITESINFSFTYTFQSSKQANANITYSISQNIQSTKWTKQLNTTTETTISTTGNNIEIPIDTIPPISVNTIQSLAAQLDQEIGVYSSEYNATITIKIQATAQTTEGTINEQFNPTLTLTFKRGTGEGDIIDIRGIENTKTGAKTQQITIYNDWVLNQRYASYGLTAAAIIGMAFTGLLYMKAKPTKPGRPEKYLEEIIEPYEDIIAEVIQEPAYKTPLTTIQMKSMEDLVKIADNLARPIIHLEKTGNNHAFYVIDETTRYEYTITAPTKEEKMRKREEED